MKLMNFNKNYGRYQIIRFRLKNCFKFFLELINLITIDSQIWIYYYDPNALENGNVSTWMKLNLKSKEIILSMIIPLEVAHNLYKIPRMSPDQIEKLLFRWITQKNIMILDATQEEMISALQMLKYYRSKGIGGRDCLILSAMNLSKVEILVTHDKNLLMLEKFKRIDPVFNPPLILEKNQVFNVEEYQKKLNSIK